MLNGITLAIMIVTILLICAFVLTLLINLLLVPLFNTPKNVLKEIVDIIDAKENDILVDLGSGDGRLLLEAYKRSKCKCVGYDISPIMLLIARTKRIINFPLAKDIVFIPDDIFKVDFDYATKMYCYLNEESTGILKKKLKKFIKNGGEIYSYKYEITNMKSEKIILQNGDSLYVYKEGKM